MNAGGTLLPMDNSTATSGFNSSTRLPSSAGLTLNGGTLSLLGADNAATTQTIGAVTLASGNSTINVVNGAGTGTDTLTAASLARLAGATVNFTGNGYTVQLTSNTGLTAAGVALPFLTIGGKVLATYTGASAPFTLGAITPITVGGGSLTAATAGPGRCPAHRQRHRGRGRRGQLDRPQWVYPARWRQCLDRFQRRHPQ